jgi:hypothetical protein
MFDLSYFNLGFRSDNVRQFLTELQSKSIRNDNLLNDAISIIDDCLKIENDDVLISRLSPSQGYEMNALLPLLAELYQGKDLKSVVKDLNQILITIDKAKNNRKKVKDEELDKAIDFFLKLTDLCLSNSSYQSVTDELF